MNATLDGFRVLKGIEADILADGRLDYGDALLDEFDFVVASVHGRFSMDGAKMTERILRALQFEAYGRRTFRIRSVMLRSLRIDDREDKPRATSHAR